MKDEIDVNDLLIGIKKLQSERDAFESDVDTLAQHNIELQQENARLQGYCETIDKLRAMDQEAANKAWVEIDRLRAALEVAKDALEQLRHKAWQKAYPAEQLRANSTIHTIDEALKGLQ